MHSAIFGIPWTAFAGGALIGAGAGALFLLRGRIAGVSGCAAQACAAFAGKAPAQSHPFLFILGIALAGLAFASPAQDPADAGGFALLAASGILCGAGSAMANGCTSGHGVCGLARLSPRSLAAVCLFMAGGICAATACGAWL